LSIPGHNGTQIGELVLAEYSSAPVVAHFAAAAKAGLWPSERELIQRYFQPGRVLDLGCGVGRVTIPLSTLGFEVVGVYREHIRSRYLFESGLDANSGRKQQS
jgi:SAM-dependent methyltransferase